MHYLAIIFTCLCFCWNRQLHAICECKECQCLTEKHCGCHEDQKCQCKENRPACCSQKVTTQPNG